MKHSDFSIDLLFLSAGGFPYLCTDVGQRTITAIPLREGSGLWRVGPPYAVQEEVFDELAMDSCALSQEDMIRAALMESNNRLIPGYPHEAVMQFMHARIDPDYDAYPNKPLLRLVKVLEGEIYRAYSARNDGEFWTLLCFRLFDNDFAEIPESQFLECPVATDDDYRAKRARM